MYINYYTTCFDPLGVNIRCTILSLYSSLQRDVHFMSLCCGSRSCTVRCGLLVNRVQNTLMVLALNLVVCALSYLGEYHLWESYNSCPTNTNQCNSTSPNKTPRRRSITKIQLQEAQHDHSCASNTPKRKLFIYSGMRTIKLTIKILTLYYS
jgi:hypothetical protein